METNDRKSKIKKSVAAGLSRKNNGVAHMLTSAQPCAFYERRRVEPVCLRQFHSTFGLNPAATSTFYERRRVEPV